MRIEIGVFAFLLVAHLLGVVAEDNEVSSSMVTHILFGHGGMEHFSISLLLLLL